MSDKLHVYENDGIRVTYDARRCVHYAACVRGLPKVFNPRKRPWVAPDEATADEIADVVERCPTGALHHHRLDGGAAEEPDIENSVLVSADGPLYLRGELELMGAYTPNSSDAILRARDKLRCHQLLAGQGIGLPTTVFGDNPDDTDDLLRLLGKPPHVIKLIEGSQGNGVVLAERLSASRSVIEAFRGLYANFLVQEFIAEAGGADIRCFVVGGRVIAAMKRQARAGFAVLSVPHGALQGFRAAADADLTTTMTAMGEVRHVAAGVEAWLANGRLGFRAGGSANTIGETRPAGSVGATAALTKGFHINVSATAGRDETVKGWSTSVSLVF